MSGSGKSTLINDILYITLANKLNGARLVPGRHRTITGIDQLDKVVHVDQSPIGRTRVLTQQHIPAYSIKFAPSLPKPLKLRCADISRVASPLTSKVDVARIVLEMAPSPLR